MLTAVDDITEVDGDVSVLGLVSDDDISVVVISSVVIEIVVTTSIVVGSSVMYVQYSLKNVRNIIKINYKK